MNDKLQQLLDIEAIKQLRVKYTHLLDSNKIEEVSQLFTKNAICQTDREPWKGRESIKKGLKKAFQQYDTYNKARYPFLHVITNQWIELKDENTAIGSCYLTDHLTNKQPKENTLLLLGVYHDHYKKIDGQWFIQSSTLDVVY
ncbi:nuclear transport factor 2 family protein [Myroides sp. LJL110]